MDEVDPPSSERPWYYDLLMELDAEGWAIANIEAYLGAVSYTHLTLPTIYSV